LLPVGDSGAAAAGVRSGVASIRFARSGYTIRRFALPHRFRHGIVAQMVGDDGIKAA
jgi:hypothetical protein